jgi:hypothetical protein
MKKNTIILMALGYAQSLQFKTLLVPKIKPSRTFKGHPIVLEMVRMCPGGHHAWFNSSIGLIRKPL